MVDGQGERDQYRYARGPRFKRLPERFLCPQRDCLRYGNRAWFRIDNRYDREIHLTGSGQKYAMVRKALLRNGIHAGCEIESESRIDAGETVESPITLYLSGNPPRQVASVEELLMCLES